MSLKVAVDKSVFSVTQMKQDKVCMCVCVFLCVMIASHLLLDAGRYYVVTTA